MRAYQRFPGIVDTLVAVRELLSVASAGICLIFELNFLDFANAQLQGNLDGPRSSMGN